MKKYLLVIVTASIMVACGGDEPIVEDNVVEEMFSDELTPERAQKAQLVFHTVPSPFETASIFQNAGTEYNGEFTNAVENVDKYVTNAQKALNLGVYGSDLSYANIFDQSQESMFYMNCSKKMSDGLGITAAFDAATMERIEENMNNRDSLMKIINDAFWIADGFLKENGQDHLSALIITGGWIEGLYIGTKSLNREAPSEELMQKIAEQKYSLDNLMALIETYDHDEVKKLEEQMQLVKTGFDKIKVEESETSVSDEGGVPTIGGGTSLKYETGTILEIADAIETIRNEIIQ